MILKSALGADLNNDTSTNNRVEPDDDDDNVSKRVLRIKMNFLVLEFVFV